MTLEISPNKERVSAAGLCSIRIPDGRYALYLKQNSIKPFGGSFHRNDDAFWQQSGFDPANDGSTDLRGYTNNISALMSIISGGKKRELLPNREIEEELIPMLQKVDPYISISDFRINFRSSTEDQQNSTDPQSLGSNTYYYLEIFDIKPNEKAAKALQLAADAGLGIVILNRTNIETGILPPVYSEGKLVENAYLIPTCKLIIDQDITASPDKITDRHLKQIAWTIAKNITFKLEKNATKTPHRLTKADIDLLRNYADYKLVEDLEHTIVLHRLSNFIIDKVIGGISESMTIYNSPGLQNGQINWPYILAIFGIIASDSIGTDIQKNSELSVEKKLRLVTKNIVENHKEDRILDLEVWANEVTRKLSAAEQFWPTNIEVVPSTVAIDLGLITQNDIATPLITSGLVAASQIVVQQALKTGGSNRQNFLRTRTAHFLSAITKYAPVLAMSVVPEGASQFIRSVAVTSIKASHIADQLDATEEIRGGIEGRNQLHEILNKFEMSIASPKRRIKHNLSILARENVGRSHFKGILFQKPDYPPVNQLRFDLIDQEIASLLGSESVQSDSEKKLSGVKLMNNYRHNLILFHDYTVSIKGAGRVILNHSNLALTGGKLNILTAPSGSGISLTLKAFADQIDHPQDSALLRLPDTDINIHGEPDDHYVSYYNCAGIEFEQIPYFLNLAPEIVEKYLSQTNLFSSDEINGFLHHKETRESGYRTRLLLAEAGLDKAPVLLLDNLFHQRMDISDLDKIIAYLKKLIEAEKIILVGTELTDGKYQQKLIDNNINSISYTIRGRKIVPLT